jgi:membrane-associated protease RseP (regulator of RpoE activity)
MKKAYWLFGVAVMAMFPLWALADLNDDDPLGGVLVSEEKNPPYQLPDYWLGIELIPAFPALVTQLHLPQHQGIVIQGVVPDSPAAKAGLAQYDVVLKADDKEIGDVSDLLKAVDAAKDKEMKLEIIRDGQRKTVAVTPTKRPEQARLPAMPPPESDIDAFRKWIENQPEFEFMGPNGPMRLQFIRPGLILPRGAPVHPPLPGNMSISITKTGDKPADITVRMDNEKWEVTEKDLDKLPEKVRPFVNRMLGMTTGVGTGALRWMPEVIAPSPQLRIETPLGPGVEPRLGQATPPDSNINLPPLENRIERRLEEMKRHIEQLENELHQRRQDLRAPKPVPPPDKNKEPTTEKAI